MALDRVLAALAPAGVRTGVRPIDPADLAALHPAELEAIERAVDLRRHEFATGRALLRAMLGDDVGIPVGPTRAPVLPSGVTGSLAHDRTLAIAAISTEPTIAALGIDVEPDGPLGEDLARIILRPDEAGLDAHQVFCLKEAAYKAWSNLGGRLLDHHEARVEIAGDRFTARMDDRLTVGGRFAHVGPRWLALVTVVGIPGPVAP
jgi:4'-phosphopantetheinyl transferase EntD